MQHSTENREPRPDSPETAYVALGANLGDANLAIEAAIAALEGLPGTRLVARSSVYRTAPVDGDGPDYLNAVAEIRTDLEPIVLLDALQRIEDRAGRLRPYRNAPRTLDLDLLLHGQQRIATPRLEVPHPRMHQRAFVLAPLAELAPRLVVPGHGPVAQLLAGVADQRVERLPG